MKKFLIAFAALAMIGTASAEGMDWRAVDAAGFNKLTESQKADVIKQVTLKAQEAKAVDNATVDKIDRWVQVGANLGKGLAATAKELGVAVNEFANTPIGKLATVLIVWHIMGSVIVHIAGALVFWGLGLYAIRFIYNRAYSADIKYNTEVRNMFGNHPKIKEDRESLSGESMFMCFVAHAAVLGAGVWILFSM